MRRRRTGALRPGRARRWPTAGIDAGRAGREGGPGADQRHRRHARHAGAGRCTTCARCCDAADITAAMSRRGAARHRRGCSPPTCRRCGRSPGRPRRAANLRRAARRLADRRQPHAGPRTPGCRTPTRCAARPQVHGAARDTLAHAATVAGRELASADRQPGGHRRTAGWSPTATSTARPSATCSTSSPSPPPTSRRSPSGAPTGCSTRPLARPAAVPGRRPRRRLRAHDRPVHPGRRSSPS